MGDISIRAMFGGGGVYCDGLIFGLIIEEVLYFKSDEASAKAFEAEGLARSSTAPRMASGW